MAARDGWRQSLSRRLVKLEAGRFYGPTPGARCGSGGIRAGLTRWGLSVAHADVQVGGFQAAEEKPEFMRRDS